MWFEIATNKQIIRSVHAVYRSNETFIARRQSIYSAKTRSHCSVSPLYTLKYHISPELVTGILI